jgi:hypothetical protein
LAQFRNGEFAPAAQSLAEAARLARSAGSEPHPACLAALAMSQQKLGNAKAANEVRQQLVESMRLPRWTADATMRDFLLEAEFTLATDDYQWKVLEPASMSSAGGATWVKLEDSSLLISGENPVHDRYTLEYPTDAVTGGNDANGLPQITALRLEALCDQRLPGGGPGRAPNGTFVLTGVNVAVVAPGDGKRTSKVVARRAIADYVQKDFDPQGLIDGPRPPGWAGWAVWRPDGPPSSQSLVLELAEPLPVASGTRLQLVLNHDSQWGQHNLGRIRLSASSTRRADRDRESE